MVDHRFYSDVCDCASHVVKTKPAPKAPDGAALLRSASGGDGQNGQTQAPGPDFVLVRDSNASDALEPFHAGWRWRIAPLRPLPDVASTHLRTLLEWESQTAERFTRYLADIEPLKKALSGLSDHPPAKPLAPDGVEQRNV